MATTSFTLTEHFEAYIRAQVETGRYATASDVMRDALRLHEEEQKKLDALRAHLQEGIDQADRGEFVENFSMDDLVEKNGISGLSKSARGDVCMKGKRSTSTI